MSITAHPTDRHALAKAAKAFAAKPSYVAYKALLAHYDDCPACAHDVNPCKNGRQLRRAWVAVRWS
ncbi:hypothetical protein ABT186_11010 [Streptomyces sp. NPDC001634]|uniref:hypothetical protein n=1 Tax=Streptomyces sp. NPDC001634 TaxID=3154390 RepID=UPI0033200536